MGKMELVFTAERSIEFAQKGITDAYLKRLPLHPHMTIEFVPLFSMPEF
jgi:hypothetical protein